MDQKPEFLKQKYNLLHVSPEVESAVQRHARRTKEKVSNKPTEKIQIYLDRMSEVINESDLRSKKAQIAYLKKVLYKDLVIDIEGIPFQYFLEQEQRIAEEQGYGFVEPTEDWYQQKASEIIDGQRRSLDLWVDYLTSEDAIYPDWAIYWVFRSVTRLTAYDRGKNGFGKRSKDSAQPFPMLNIGALAATIDAIQNHIKLKGDLNKEERAYIERVISRAIDSDKIEKYKKILSTENFGKIYAFHIDRLSGMSWENLEVIDGEWKIYKQNSDPQTLYDSLQGYPLDWCTAQNLETARTQLRGGDFHVYYSNNSRGDSVIPRLAIRMEGSNIAEIRGIMPDQNIDEFISPVLDEKLIEFGSQGEQYLKRSSDMKMLSYVTSKYRTGEELNRDDLRFIYEIDFKIESFSQYAQIDPRIEEIKKFRNINDDLIKIFANGDMNKVSYDHNNITDDTFVLFDRLPLTKGQVVPARLRYVEAIDVTWGDNDLAWSIFRNGIVNLWSFIDQLHRFSGLDEELFVELLDIDPFKVMENWYSFDITNQHLIVKKLLNISPQTLMRYLDYFEEVEPNDIAVMMCENFQSIYIIDYIDSFPNLSLELIIDILNENKSLYDISYREIKVFREYFSKRLNNGEFGSHNGVAHDLLNNGLDIWLCELLSGFKELDTSVAKSLLDAEYRGCVQNNLASFKSLSNSFVLSLEDEL